MLGNNVPNARVLLVEDEFLIRIMLAEALTEVGLEVVDAAGGEEGIRCLDQSPQFDLIITDVQMPGLTDGIEVARHARKRFPEMPIIFATARPDSVRAFKERREFDTVIQKPYGPDQVIALVRGILES